MQRPIFILGTMRSGSTLFRLILDSHPRIAISEETGFMGALAANRSIPQWLHGAQWYDRLGWTEQDFDVRLREFYSGLFERYAAANGKSRWGDKTPFHARHIEDMARVFPDAVFVAIVRHPGAVVHSLVRRFHYTAAQAADYWESTNTEILRHGIELGEQRFALVRYEDLVGHPEDTLRELMDWLGEQWSDDLLRHNDVQTAKNSPRIVDGGTRTRDPISRNRVDRWAEALDPAARAVVIAATGPLAGFLGYDASHPDELAHVVPPDESGRTRLLTGGGLARRRREHPEGPSFQPRQLEIADGEMDPADLLARARRAEAALVRIRSRRVVRLAGTVRRAQRWITGLPMEALSAGRRALPGDDRWKPRRGAVRRDAVEHER